MSPFKNIRKILFGRNPVEQLSSCEDQKTAYTIANAKYEVAGYEAKTLTARIVQNQIASMGCGYGN